jgi:hypothetical protein
VELQTAANQHFFGSKRHNGVNRHRFDGTIANLRFSFASRQACDNR